MGTIRFELRKEKKDKEGHAPVRVIYQVQGQRKYHSTGIKIHPDYWDEKSQQAKYVKKGLLLELDVKKINNELSDTKRAIEKLEDKHKANGTTYSPEIILNELKAKDKPVQKKDNSSKELYAFIDRYIKDHLEIRVKGSLSVYKSLKSHLEGYEKKVGKTVTFDKIDYAFFQGFRNYLIGLGTINNVTIAKQLSTLKTFLNYAVANDIEVNSRYHAYKVKREKIEDVIALTQEEFDILWNMDLSKRPAWEQVRDVFMFSCVTGYRYSDLKQLKWGYIYWL